MIDAEVVRLRRLRDSALRARALAQALSDEDSRVDSEVSSLISRSALVCWGIARSVSGRLRAHPYQKFQQGPSPVTAALDRASTVLTAGLAKQKDRKMSVLAKELQQVVREVDDTRALTWLPDLSDTLGRYQVLIRGLARDIAAAATTETGSRVEIAQATVARDAVASEAVENWPYLAI